jgi:type IV secretory pathway TraG/TraD family ATPase VirD4
MDAALRLARSLPAGRLRVPLVVELDEAANICKWKDLPDLYSHFGSQGIIVTTYLQSWPQGEAVWGREGMGKLWGAVNVAVLGPGLRDAKLLEDVSKLIGDHDVEKVSHSSSRSGPSRSISTVRERIMSVSALADLPPGRMIVLGSGAPATIAEPVSWWETEHAAGILESQRKYAYDPEKDEAPAETDEPKEMVVADVVAALADVPSTGELTRANPWMKR